MSVRPIRQLGDPVLRTRCQAVERPAAAAARLVADDLRDTLAAARKKYRMGRALAAPQIGAPLRIVVADTEGLRGTLVNPEITDVGPDDFTVWDDCFSFPSLYVRVTRAHRVTLSYLDLRGRAHEVALEGGLAELVQHEIDHLDGILAVDRATGLDPFAFRREWEKTHTPGERYGAPFAREVG